VQSKRKALQSSHVATAMKDIFQILLCCRHAAMMRVMLRFSAPRGASVPLFFIRCPLMHKHANPTREDRRPRREINASQQRHVRQQRQMSVSIARCARSKEQRRSAFVNPVPRTQRGSSGENGRCASENRVNRIHVHRPPPRLSPPAHHLLRV